MIIFSSRTIAWEDFIKQLEPEELKQYEGIRFMAKELEEPQRVIIEGITIGLIWPSGRFQPAKEINREMNIQEFIGDW